MNKKIITQLSLAAALAVVGTAAFFAFRSEKPSSESRSDGALNPVREEGQSLREDAARMASADAAHRATGEKPAGGGQGTPQGSPTYGRIPPVPATKNIQTRLAYEAQQTGKYPYRLSAAVMPPAFDAKRWDESREYRENYLNEPAPARCYQSAQPGKDVPRVALAGPAYAEVHQNQPVVLTIKTKPGYPATFTCVDAAPFQETGLTTATVLADEQGFAKATLVPTGGIINDCRIQACGPGTSGQVHMTVHVVVPLAVLSAKPDPATTPPATP